MKTSTQLKAKVRNLSAKTGIQPYIIQRNYFLERFLERLSLSRYRDSIVLKGGVLISSMLGIEARSTMDLDATMKARTLTNNEVLVITGEILQIPMDDGVAFSVIGAEETRVEADYPGCRVTLGAALDKLLDTVKVDFTAGDVITPKPIEYGYKLMFEDREIRVLAYNVETVLSEKFIAVLSFNVVNTRMKDFYDLYMLITEHNDAISPGVFTEAVNNTARQRQMLHLVSQAEQIVDTIAGNPVTADLWKRYRTVYPYAADIMFDDVTKTLRKLIEWLTI